MEVIQSVAWRPFAIPFRAEHRAAHGTQRVREGLIVRVRTSDGRTGIGEASPLPSFSGGSVEGAARVLAGHAPAIVGQAPADAPLPFKGAGGDFGAARCGIVTAVYAIAAEQHGLPLWADLAQANADKGHPLRIAVNGLIDALPPAAAAHRAEALARAGFTTIKVKLGAGEGVEVDFARMAAVRAAAPGVRLRADANGGWSRAEAEELIRRLNALDLELIEQPLAAGPGAYDRLARLARGASPIPIFVDESFQSLADLDALARRPAITGVVVKPMVLGLTEAAILLDATDSGLRTFVTTTLDAGPGTVAAIHLAALLPESRRACGLATLDLLEDDLILDAPAIKDGYIAVPDAPGLGVELDEAALDHYATGPWIEVRA